MKTYRIPLVPGPVAVAPTTLAAYGHDYGSSNIEPEFGELYRDTARLVGEVMCTRNDVVIALGEAMVVLWGAIKSTLGPGDRLLAISSGLFGEGFADMARAVGADVRIVAFPWDTVPDPDTVMAVAREYNPTLITMVHCETPSGTVTPVEAIGRRLRAVVPDALFAVDAVASLGGTPLDTDAAGIDFCLLGSQKCLATVPDVGMVAVSARGWERVMQLNYQGYDALAPFRHAATTQYFPYTHSWHAVAALHSASTTLLTEGLANVQARHARIAQSWRDQTRALGLELYPRDEAYCAPTVTALKMPAGFDWLTLDARLRARGMVVGNNYGPLDGKAFRIGHMGTQATDELLEHGIAVLRDVLHG